MFENKRERIESLVNRHPYAYMPTRYEYIAVAVLQGLVTGRSLKDAKKCVGQAIELTDAMEAELATPKNN